jgi:hypothetical protein
MSLEQIKKLFGTIDGAGKHIQELQRLKRVAEEESDAIEYLNKIESQAKKEGKHPNAIFASRVRVIRNNLDNASSYQIKEQLFNMANALDLFCGGDK